MPFASDTYRTRGVFVALGGLHVTSLPAEAAPHADAIFLGPGEQTFPQFLADLRAGAAQPVYRSTSGRTIEDVPPVRRDLIRRKSYLVPNSIVVTRGCPQHCDFCYKDAFFTGGRSFYTQRVDAALAEISRLPGRHLYFLDVGVPRVLSLAVDRRRLVHARHDQASGQTFHVRGGLEKVRVPVERNHPRAAVAGDDTDARSGPRQGHWRRWRRPQYRD